MGDRNDKYKKMFVEACQEHVSEPVREVAILSRSGGMTRMGVMHISPLASGIMGHDAKKRSGGLPPTVMVAVTDSAIHLFAYRQGRSSVKIKSEVGTWSRDGLRVTVSDGRMANLVGFDFPDGGHVELESSNLGGDFNDAALMAMGAQRAG
jgi:hypothetical protein